MKQAGHEAVIVSSEADKQFKGKKGKETLTSEKAAKDMSVDGFDALVISGSYSPDHLRMDSDVVDLEHRMV